MTMVDAPPRAGRREWLALAVLCLPTLLTTVDISVLILALPKLNHDIGASSMQQLWITDIYGFMIAGFLVLMGSWGDRVGHRRVLLTGAAAFIATSALAAYSGTPELLLLARALLGISAATVMPSVLALIGQMFRDPRQMGAAMGIWGSSIMLGVILGPVVGGLLLSAFWWGSIFLMGMPIMALLLILGPSLLPNAPSPFTGPMDVLSVIYSLASMLSFVYGLKMMAWLGLQPQAFGGLLVGIGFGIPFVIRQRQLSQPMLDLSLFGDRVIRAAVIFGLLFGAVMAGSGFVVTVYLQVVEEMSALRVALWLAIPALFMIVGGNLGPALARRVRPGVILSTGLVIAAVGMLFATTVDRSSGFGMLIVGMVITYAGASPGAPLTNMFMMSSAPPGKFGAVGSLASTSGELGVALGVAVLGSAGNAVYGHYVDVPPGLPPEHAIPAGASILGADDISDELAVPVANQLMESAREAFTHSLHTVVTINALLLIGLAVLVLRLFGHIQPIGQGGPGAPPGPAGDGPAGDPVASNVA